MFHLFSVFFVESACVSLSQFVFHLVNVFSIESVCVTFSQHVLQSVRKFFNHSVMSQQVFHAVPKCFIQTASVLFS